jgi:hypothetical protein
MQPSVHPARAAAEEWSPVAHSVDAGGLFGPRTVVPAEPLTAERVLAVVGIVLLAARITLPQSLTVGTLVACATIPVWYPVTRRYVGARWLLHLGLLSIPAGLLLTLLSSADHTISRTDAVTQIAVLLGVLTGFGFLLWARTVLGDRATATLFGFGLLLALAHPGPLYASNPWKFGFSVPVTITVLGLLHTSHKLAQLVALALLVGISAITDARSSFGILLLTGALLAWQLRPGQGSRRRTGVGALLGLAVLAVLIYNAGQTLILNGYLGAETRQRSLEQLDASGSLILGGRPEITATVALMRHHILGFGAGTLPSFSDITVAKTGMSAINYDPENGYVDHFMFGNGFSLHSMFGDLWADFGLVGLAFCIAMAVVLVLRVGQTTANGLASGLLLYLALRSLWNIAFSPFYSAVPVLMLTLALVLAERPVAARAAPR